MTHRGRLLVFGASGYTGQSVVTLGRASGHEVHAHLRPGSPSAENLRPPWAAMDVHIHEVAWTAPTITELVRATAPTHVFCLLGTTRKKAAAAGSGAGYAEVDVGMTMMVVDAVAASKPAARLVYLSSMGVHAKARGAYLQARWQVEEQIRTRLRNWVIAQPSFITGDDRGESRPGERIAAKVADPILSAMGMLGLREVRDRYASVTGRQLAAGLLHHALDATNDTRTVDAADLRGHLQGAS